MGKQDRKSDAVLTKPENQLTEAQVSNDVFQRFSTDTPFHRRGSEAGQVVWDPSTGFGESQYDEDLKPQTTIDFDNFHQSLEQSRASKQPLIDQLGNAAARLTNVVPEAIGGIASVLDFEDYWNVGDEVGNGVTRLMEDWKEATNEEFPIYQDERGAAFNMTDTGWWVENGSGMVNSVLGFALTGGGVAKGLQTLSKVTKAKKLAKAMGIGSNTANKLGEIGQTLGVSIGLNQAEAVMEASEVFNETYNFQLEKLADQYQGEELEAKAREIAGNAASTTINTNRINILLNLTSANLFVKSPTLTRNILNKPVTYKNIGKIGVEGLQESAEEMINYVAGQRGRAVGKGKDYTLANAISDIGSSESLESAFWGFLGGTGQTIVTTEGINRLQKTVDPETGDRMSVRDYNQLVYDRQREVLDNTNAERVGDIINNYGDNLKIQSQIEAAVEEGDAGKVKSLQDLMLANQALTHFKNGTTEIFEQYFKDIEKRDVQQADNPDYKEVAVKAQKRIRELERVYTSVSGRANNKDLYINRATALNLSDQFDDLKLRNNEIISDLNKKIERLNELKPEEEKIDVINPVFDRTTILPDQIENSPEYIEYKDNNKELKNILASIEQLDTDFRKTNSAAGEKAYVQKITQLTDQAVTKQEKNDEVLEAEAKVMDDFYRSVEGNGHEIQRGPDGTISGLGDGITPVTFKNSNDEVFTINPSKQGFAAKNLKTGDSFPINPKTIIASGLNSDKNILTPQQFKKWQKLDTIKTKNNERLKALNKLISDHNRTKARFESDHNALMEELKNYNNEIKFWQGESDFNAADVKREIDRLTEKRDKIDGQLKTLDGKRSSLSDTLIILDDYRKTLEDLVADPDNYEEFSFGVELEKLEKKLREGQFDMDQIELTESLGVVAEWIDELTDVRNAIQDTIDDLYDLYDETIGITSDIESNFRTAQEDNPGLDLTQLEERYDFDKDWNDMRADQREILQQIDIKKSDLKEVKDQLNLLYNELDNIYKNEDLLRRYDKLKINLSTLEKRNNIKKNSEIDLLISPNQKKDGPNDPIEQVSSNDTRDYKTTKETPYSTITNVFKYDRANGTLVYKDGLPVYSDNWQQASNWSRTMGNITMDNITSYNLRFVNNVQLQELGQKPPVADDDALYTVLYKGTTPYNSDVGLVYTGVANVSTYYNTEFDNVEDQDALKGEYGEWRLGILSRLDKGEDLYSNIIDISPGYARRDDVKKAPKSVFNVKKLAIPIDDRIGKTNRGFQTVVPGMVYGDIGNGQYERLLNHSISSLPEKKKAEKINTILKFMTLAEEVKGNNFKKEFNYKNSKSSLPLVGQGTKTGILDYFINWGNKKNNPDWNIAIYEEQNVHNIRFTHDGLVETIPLSDLKDDNGKIRQYGDPEIQTLTDFLETKYLNVVRNELNKNPKEGKSKWIPKDWIMTKNGPQITFDKYKSYNDYVLENNLYTEVVKSDESLGELPSFVNQYATFEKEPKGKPVIKKIAKKVEPAIVQPDLSEQLLAAAKKSSEKEEPPVTITEDNAADFLAAALFDASDQAVKKDPPKEEKKTCERKGGLKKKKKKKGGDRPNFRDIL